MSTPTEGHRFAVFRHASYTRFFVSRFLNSFSTQVVSVAVGWQMYDLTGDPFMLGLIGLMQFWPSLALILVTGSVADRYNRRMVMAVCLMVCTACAAALLGLTTLGLFAPLSVFAVLVVFGVARAFLGPAMQSLAPNLVPAKDLSNAIAWNSTAQHTATIVGPVTGGVLYGVGATVPYAVSIFLFVAASVAVISIPKPPQRIAGSARSWESLVAGFRYIRAEKVVLGAISLDLFAVLLGGAIALMPVFARDILALGPWGLGLLRSAPGVGSVGMAVFLAANPIRHRVGALMLIGVGLFGVGTVVFGLSQWAWLSVAALVIMGASDMISVYVRNSLVMLWTPDELRGRVTAVNMVFVGASNELGEFRAGTMAALVGAVPAVVIGGIGTIAVAVLWAFWFPKLRQIDSLAVPDRHRLPG